eukprot:11116661-Alexandrium_andersonii.AAC.1
MASAALQASLARAPGPRGPRCLPGARAPFPGATRPLRMRGASAVVSFRANERVGVWVCGGGRRVGDQ